MCDENLLYLPNKNTENYMCDENLLYLPNKDTYMTNQLY